MTAVEHGTGAPGARDAVNVRSYHVPVEGFSQAIRAAARGELVFVSGLTARSADGAVGPVGDSAGQTRRILEALDDILREAGGSLNDVVRTVTYLVDINHHADVHAVRREFFGDAPPASTTVQISRLYHQDQLLEIEATALIGRTAGADARS
jgi:2-iminobutanoate/2-iminopropanoate deaminase